MLHTAIKSFERIAAIATDGEKLGADAVLAAVGRSPDVGSLNLPAAGVHFNNWGIVVDEKCRSSASTCRFYLQKVEDSPCGIPPGLRVRRYFQSFMKTAGTLSSINYETPDGALRILD